MPTASARKAGVEDAEVVARFVHALLDELSGGRAPNAEKVLQDTRAILAHDGGIALMAYLDEEPVGLMAVNECLAIYAGGRYGVITELYVPPDFRSHGVAPRLLSLALAEGRDRGWSRLEVTAPSQPAWKRTLSFYLRNGFVETGPRLRRLI